MNAKQMMWKFLIEKGEITTGYSYYGGYVVDYDKTGIWRDFSERGLLLDMVDWEKTSEVKDNLISQFMGTFCEDDEIDTLEGTLVTTKGEELEWVLCLCEGVSTSNMINDVLRCFQEV